MKIGQGKPVIIENDDEELSSTEGKIIEMRAERNNLLALSDDYVLPDRNLSEQLVAKWKIYRQALRDFTGNSNTKS